MDTAIILYVLAVALGVASLVLVVVGVRRFLQRETEIVTVMLRRFDDRLAEFAQTLNDAVAQAVADPGRREVIAAEDPALLMRTLELARETTRTEGAIAIVTGVGGTPTFATVGLSDAETQHMARLGNPDYRGARAIEIALTGELEPPAGAQPIRAGLVVRLLDERDTPSVLAVLSRSIGHRFSEEDVEALDGIVKQARPALERSLGLRELDVVPELDPLTGLYDRRAFAEIIEREIERARGSSVPLALLVIDVDRLTTLNARVGRLRADAVLSAVGHQLQTVKGRLDNACRLEGGRFAVLCPGALAEDGRALFERLQAQLRSEAAAASTVSELVSLTAGAAELLPGDDAEALTERADAALLRAKSTQRGTLVVAG